MYTQLWLFAISSLSNSNRIQTLAHRFMNWVLTTALSMHKPTAAKDFFTIFSLLVPAAGFKHSTLGLSVECSITVLLMYNQLWWRTVCHFLSLGTAAGFKPWLIDLWVECLPLRYQCTNNSCKGLFHHIKLYKTYMHICPLKIQAPCRCRMCKNLKFKIWEGIHNFCYSHYWVQTLSEEQ